MAGLEHVCRPRLVWPASVRRRRADWLPSSAFRAGGRAISPSTATDRVIAALEAFTKPGKAYRTTAVEIAADWDVGRLGGFLASSRNPSRDPGAVLSFDLDGRALTLPCDRYDSVGGNLAAIAKHLEPGSPEAWDAFERHRAWMGRRYKEAQARAYRGRPDAAEAAERRDATPDVFYMAGSEYAVGFPGRPAFEGERTAIAKAFALMLRAGGYTGGFTHGWIGRRWWVENGAIRSEAAS